MLLLISGSDFLVFSKISPKHYISYQCLSCSECLRQCLRKLLIGYLASLSLRECFRTGRPAAHHITRLAVWTQASTLPGSARSPGGERVSTKARLVFTARPQRSVVWIVRLLSPHSLLVVSRISKLSDTTGLKSNWLRIWCVSPAGCLLRRFYSQRNPTWQCVSAWISFLQMFSHSRIVMSCCAQCENCRKRIGGWGVRLWWVWSTWSWIFFPCFAN